jgi:hypothetical protein
MANLKDQIDVLRAGGVPAEQAIEAAHLVSNEMVSAHLAAKVLKAEADADVLYAASPEGQEAAVIQYEADTAAYVLRAARARTFLEAEGQLTAAACADLSDAQALRVAGWSNEVTEDSLAAGWSKLTDEQKKQGCKSLGVSVEAFAKFGGVS